MVKKESEKKQRIAPRDAAAAAGKYFGELTGTQQALSVEEIELSEDGRYWFVTLGFSLSYLIGPKSYKVFKVDAYTGEVLSMKIREL